MNERLAARRGRCALVLLPVLALVVAPALVAPVLLLAQADPAAQAMNQPVEPFRILGNLYYVGASDVTSFLIATDRGLIVLDGGFVETAPRIRDNIAKLGFEPRDVKILLNSHAHYDHAGGLAQLAAWTGAKVVASAGDKPALEAGGKDSGLQGILPFPPVKVDRVIADGAAVTLGSVTMVAHVTAGHTPGCTSWTMQVHDGGKTYDVVFLCSTSVLSDYRLLDHPTFPGIAESYERTFKTLAALPCDVFLGSHATFYDGAAKAARLRAGVEPNPFIDPAGYRGFVQRAEAAFHERLEAERARLQAPPRR